MRLSISMLASASSLRTPDVTDIPSSSSSPLLKLLVLDSDTPLKRTLNPVGDGGPELFTSH